MDAEPERQLADPPATWQEHWFDHRQLLQLYHSDEHCAIYLDPDVRRAGRSRRRPGDDERQHGGEKMMGAQVFDAPAGVDGDE